MQPQTVQIEPKVVAQSPQALVGNAIDAAQSPQTLATSAGHYRSPRRNVPNVAGTPNAGPINEVAAAVGDIDVNQNDVITTTGADVDVNDDPANQLDANVADDGPVSQHTQNEPKTYAQFFKSDNLSSGINFVSANTNNTNARTPTNNTNSFATRTPTLPTDIRNDTTPNALAGANATARTGPRPDSRPGQIRGMSQARATSVMCPLDTNSLLSPSLPFSPRDMQSDVRATQTSSVTTINYSWVMCHITPPKKSCESCSDVSVSSSICESIRSRPAQSYPACEQRPTTVS